ncbi:hypothetical protein V1291_004836 [Nitrobacteraceae bacterium AZCC 1564]
MAARRGIDLNEKQVGASSYWRSKLSLFPDMRDAFVELYKEHPLAIVFKHTRQTSRVENAGVEKEFDMILSEKLAGFFTSHPKVYELALRAFGAPAHKVVLVSANGIPQSRTCQPRTWRHSRNLAVAQARRDVSVRHQAGLGGE